LVVSVYSQTEAKWVNFGVLNQSNVNLSEDRANTSIIGIFIVIRDNI